MAPWALLAALWLSAGSLSAEQFGLFTYEVRGASVEITFYPKDAGGDVSIPAQIAGLPVTKIGLQAFSYCSGLTSVTIPASVTSIGFGAFGGCTGLAAEIFLGDPPELIGCGGSAIDIFEAVAPNSSLYYLSTSNGFTSPLWSGYPAVEVDLDQYPAGPWLLEHGLLFDTDLHQDLNNDGVSLLMAYVLNLDPRQNLRGQLPVPVLTEGALSFYFHAASPGITYTVQTSTDLQNWSTEGVTTSGLDPDGHRTATVARDTPHRFLRLVVE